jgi:hypothetical protein
VVEHSPRHPEVKSSSSVYDKIKQFLTNVKSALMKLSYLLELKIWQNIALFCGHMF